MRFTMVRFNRRSLSASVAPLPPLSHSSHNSRVTGARPVRCGCAPESRLREYSRAHIFVVTFLVSTWGEAVFKADINAPSGICSPWCTVKAFFAAVYALRHSTAAFMLRVLLYENTGGVTAALMLFTLFMLFMLLARPALTGSIPSRGPVELRYGCRRPNTVYAVYAISSLDTEGSLRHDTQKLGARGARQDGARRPWAVQGS